jgi:hypothetical protein
MRDNEHEGIGPCTLFYTFALIVFTMNLMTTILAPDPDVLLCFSVFVFHLYYIPVKSSSSISWKNGKMWKHPIPSKSHISILDSCSSES